MKFFRIQPALFEHLLADIETRMKRRAGSDVLMSCAVMRGQTDTTIAKCWRLKSEDKKVEAVAYMTLDYKSDVMMQRYVAFDIDDLDQVATSLGFEDSKSSFRGELLEVEEHVFDAVKNKALAVILDL